MGTPIGQQMIAEEQAETEAVRQTAADEIVAAKAELAEKHPPLLAEYKKSQKETVKAEKNVLKKKQVEHTKWGAAHDVDWRVGHRIKQAEKILRANADPRIDEFITELSRISEYERQAGPDYWDAIDRDAGHWTRHTNIEGCRVRWKAIGAAQDAAEELKFEAGVNVAAALEEIRRQIPEAGAPKSYPVSAEALQLSRAIGG